MSWKKNGLSVILWAAFLLGSSAALMYYMYETFRKWGYEDKASMALGAGVWAALFVFFVVVRLTVLQLARKVKPVGDTAREVFEGILFVGLLAVGIGIRIYSIQYAGEAANYFDVAKVAEGSVIPSAVHGANYVYLHLLRLLYLLVGNQWMAGIWLQIGLQALAAILIYLAVRQISGTFAGLGFLAVIMLAPAEILNGLTYSPDMLYLCVYAIGLVCVASFLGKYAEGEMQSAYDVILLVFSGAWIAFVCYLDISGVTLLAMAACVLWLRKIKSERKSGNAWLGLGVLILSTVAFLTGYLVLYGYSCHKGLSEVLKSLAGLYAVKGQDEWFWMSNAGSIVSIILHCGMVVAAFSYFFHRKSEKLSPWICAGLVLCIMEYYHISSAQLDSYGLMAFVAGALGGLGISECLSLRDTAREKLGVEAQRIGISEEENQEEQNALQEDSEYMQAETTTVSDDMEFVDLGEPKKMKFIDNPLPMPKKHVRKTMEYSFIPDESMMHYDIEVDENDDYDR